MTKILYHSSRSGRNVRTPAFVFLSVAFMEDMRPLGRIWAAFKQNCGYFVNFCRPGLQASLWWLATSCFY